MTDTLRIVMAQLNLHVGDVHGNLARLIAAAQQAFPTAAAGVDGMRLILNFDPD